MTTWQKALPLWQQLEEVARTLQEEGRETAKGIVDHAARKLKDITEMVNEQAEDPGLWAGAQYASEEYIQMALRRLHSAIED